MMWADFIFCSNIHHISITKALLACIFGSKVCNVDTCGNMQKWVWFVVSREDCLFNLMKQSEIMNFPSTDVLMHSMHVTNFVLVGARLAYIFMVKQNHILPYMNW